MTESSLPAGHHMVHMSVYARFKGLVDASTENPAVEFCQDCAFRCDELIDFRYLNSRRGYCRSAVKCPPGSVYVDEATYAKGKLLGAW